MYIKHIIQNQNFLYSYGKELKQDNSRKRIIGNIETIIIRSIIIIYNYKLKVINVLK